MVMAMDEIDILNVKDAALSCGDAEGNGSAAQYRAASGDRAGCIESLEWMLKNLATATSKAKIALARLRAPEAGFTSPEDLQRVVRIAEILSDGV